jgi:hypothetical protein
MTVTTHTTESAAGEGDDQRAAAPRRLAVFGSVSAERPSRTIVAAPESRAREVLEQVFAAIAEQAPLIALPVLDRAVGAGDISSSERDELLRELAQPQSSGDTTDTPAATIAARAALREALGEVRLASPGIAQPILHDAVAEGLLTAAQEQRIIARLRTSPGAAFRPARSGD